MQTMMTECCAPTKKLKTSLISFARLRNGEGTFVAIVGEQEVAMVQEPEVYEVAQGAYTLAGPTFACDKEKVCAIR